MMLSDDELSKLKRDELIHQVQRLQHEKLGLLHDHGNKMKDVNQRLQTHLLEIRNLKEINKKLQDDNQELRDLCCFLDDDRQKFKKLSKEWQRFGRYTSSVIKTEIATHQTKFQDLSSELESMLKCNEELKELIIYLDDERCSALRDQGDGSSGNSEDNPPVLNSPSKTHKIPNEDTKKYIQHLEQLVELLQNQLQKQQEKTTDNPWVSTTKLTQAMKVLEVHKSIENPSHSAIRSSPSSQERSMNTQEKALLRELCNVAWKALEEETPTRAPRVVSHQSSRV